MRLSILIPTRNFAPSVLVKALNSQATALHIDCEILVLDDASDDAEALSALRAIEQSGACRVIWCQERQGRARARNILYKESQGELLLFIDSDAQVCSSGFLSRHLEDAKQAPVICGALINPAPPAPAGCELRYKYEAAAEKKGHRTADYRNRHPYDRLATFQLLLHRSVMERITFDESLTEYGYEDVIFGLRLQELGIPVLHTDNALLHTGINPNADFLANTEAAMRTLSGLPLPYKRRIGLSRFALRLKGLRLDAPLRLIFRLAAPAMRSNLLGSTPSLTLFQAYKLGYYLSL